MAIQICPNCGKELEKVKVISYKYMVWNTDHYEDADVEVFYNCPNCGEYLDNEDFE